MVVLLTASITIAVLPAYGFPGSGGGNARLLGTHAYDAPGSWGGNARLSESTAIKNLGVAVINIIDPQTGF